VLKNFAVCRESSVSKVGLLGKTPAGKAGVSGLKKIGAKRF
jgi:hypothetical protein